ncbi:reverse transcriptase domain-containing protein [Solemya velum gill symbiont]|uniref:reverse transcriptase domain-containing protein n=1 Tax=Solemya velum gill symbiont TaxID=2340 RepID=UPI001E447687|nr:reverse transcriptase domain-containing protein [Solemya velum gill symbiont]
MSHINQTIGFPTVKDQKGTIIVNPQQKADAFANHFADVSSDSNYSETFLKHKSQFEIEHESLLLSTEMSYHVYNEPFTFKELKSALSYTSESSPGLDNVHYTLLKNLPIPSLSILLELYNLIWHKQTLPTSWKHSVIVPIRKPGKDPTNLNAYRPIALTSCLCKLMERMVNNRLMWYLEKNCLLSETQSGFRNHRSTTEILVRLEAAIHQAFVNKEYLVAVFLDFEKAYDMLWKKGLLYKLHSLGIEGNMFGWIRSFLEERTFQVRLNQHLSKVCSVSNGTPQGSVISPTLFNIMVNDLHTVLKNCSISQFADDSSVWASFMNIWTAKRVIEEDLLNISNWCNQWGFKLSDTKTLTLVFARRKIPDDFYIKMGNLPLNLVSNAKVLGVIFDRRLVWSMHVDNLLARCKSVLNILKVLAGTDWGGHPRQMLQLYRALIRSRLDYGCQVYNSASPSVKSRLDTIQAQGLRICLGVPRTTPNEALQVEAGEMPLQLRRDQLSATYYVKSLALPTTHPLVDELSIAYEYYGQHVRFPYNATPFIVRVSDTLRQIPLREIFVDIVTPVPFPPWHLHTPEVCFDICDNCPKSNTPSKLKAIADEYIEKNCSQSIKIFTDGSKIPSGETSSAFVIPELKVCRGYKLPPHVCVFTCELVAILMALYWVDEFRPIDATIFTDSLSALQSMIHIGKHPRKIVLEILGVYTSMFKHGISLRFVWVPSHVGIMGNELADKAAKAALSSISEVSVPHSISEIGSLVKTQIMIKWQNRWNLSSHGRDYYKIKQYVSRTIITFGKTRREETLYFRLRLGQCNLRARLKLIRRHPTGLCECGVPETVTHYLFDCGKYIVQRIILLRTLNELRLKHNLTVLNEKQAVAAIIKYINDTGKYKEL